jgi:phosphoserine aminotransferase
MPERIFNFAAGPCTLPLTALQKAQSEFVNFQNSGMSLFEMSHRGKIYDALHTEAVQVFRDVYGIPSTHTILFIGGGATLQFMMIPMNFLPKDGFAEYINTGTWGTKALKDGQLLGDARELASGKETNFMTIPKDWKASPDAAYVHITTNNTIKGTQWQTLPDVGNTPLIADMSSDFMSKPVDWAKIALAYGGAQKNLGPAGMAVVIIRDDMLAKASKNVPAYMRYDLHAENNSMYNTPPMFQIYMLKLVMEWVKDVGGLAQMEKNAELRSNLIYNVIDQYGDYYSCPVNKADRSRMNLCFRLPTEDLEKKFIAEALERDMSGLKGHRSVGGCRASLYNAMPIEGAQTLANFMVEFMNKNPK